MDTKHILVVDDEEQIRCLLSSALSSAGFRVTVAADGMEALSLLMYGDVNDVPVDLLLTDFNLPYFTGLEIIDTLEREGVSLPSLVMSGDHDEALVSEVYARGCAGFLGKPFSVPLLVDEIHRALNGACVATGDFCE